MGTFILEHEARSSVRRFIDGPSERCRLYGIAGHGMHAFPTFRGQCSRALLRAEGRDAAWAERGFAVWYGNYYAVRDHETARAGRRARCGIGIVHYNTEDEVERAPRRVVAGSLKRAEASRSACDAPPPPGSVAFATLSGPYFAAAAEAKNAPHRNAISRTRQTTAQPNASPGDSRSDSQCHVQQQRGLGRQTATAIPPARAREQGAQPGDPRHPAKEKLPRSRKNTLRLVAEWPLGE